MHDESLDIAIVGIACRFPGAPSALAFWHLLLEGRDAGTVFTDDELRAAGVDAARLADPRCVKVGYPLANAELFDAAYFQIPDGEAELLDPQHRHFLECAVEALEDAGHDPRRNLGRTEARAGDEANAETDVRVGVYAGVSLGTYLLSNVIERYEGASLLEQYRIFVANDKDFLPTRVSHKLDLRGPSLAVNTACSSSLVAVHVACTALLSGECDVALAGAAHVRVPQVASYIHQEAMILSRDGRCRPFDRAASGTNVGSGVAVVVLKRLHDALRDGDSIYAVIKGSAVNNDGALKVGFTAPSVEGQAAVIAAAHRSAGVDASTIGYVEAHGTGTPLGDPAELSALGDVFAGVPRGSVAIGAVKGNVGHLDTASGLAGLIKTSLMLRHRRFVPTAHFDSGCAALEQSPFFVDTTLREWPAPARGGPRRAGVSSFGIGGTNAHVVLEEAPPPEARAPDSSPRLLLLSARSPEALATLRTNLARHLNRNPTLELRDVAFTLGRGRRAHAHRCALVARSTRDAAMALALADPARLIAGHAAPDTRTSVVIRDGATEDELRAIASEWVTGADLSHTDPSTGRRISLPTYPFERRRFWIEPTRKRSATAREAPLREQIALASTAERVTLVEDFLCRIVAQILGDADEDPSFDPTTNLFDVGLDSLMLIELASKLSDELGRSVRATTFIEHPNIRAFVGELMRDGDAHAAAPTEK